MKLSFRQLQVIATLAEERSFTAAGTCLGLSQQSVSALLRSAEDRLGVRLFDRTTRTVEPTPTCQRILPDLVSGLNLIGAALDSVKAGHSADRPLVLAVSPAVAFGELRLILEILEKSSLPEPEMREVWSDELVAGVCEGRFDAGIGIAVPDDPHCDIRPWRSQRIDLLVARSHPFATLDEIPVARLEETVMIMPGDKTNPTMRDKLMDTFRQAGVHPRLSDVARIAGPAPVDVERGLAATVWLSGMDERYMPNGLVRVRLCNPETIVTTSLVTARRRPRRASRSLAALQSAMASSSNMAAGNRAINNEIA